MKSALILIGGNASRANGYPKHQFKVGNKTFLEKQVEELRLCTDEIFIIGRDPEQETLTPQLSDIQYIHDIWKGQGPAGGIHAGAWHAKGEYFFVTACDMPFLSCKVISYLFSRAKGFGAAVPVWDNGKMEPLCAVYSRESVQEYFKSHKQRRLSYLVGSIHARLIPISEIKVLDPELNVFVNINDMDSLSTLKKND